MLEALLLSSATQARLTLQRVVSQATHSKTCTFAPEIQLTSIPLNSGSAGLVEAGLVEAGLVELDVLLSVPKTHRFPQRFVWSEDPLRINYSITITIYQDDGRTLIGSVRLIRQHMHITIDGVIRRPVRSAEAGQTSNLWDS